jgi:hypothetical protein
MHWTAIESWEKVSEHLFLHVSGARIERKGYPQRYGWYLVPADAAVPPLFFDPTPGGCDQAFIAFAAGYGIACASRVAG